MGKKKNKNGHNHDHDHEGEKKEEEVVQKKEAGDGGDKKDGGKNPPAMVFKVEMHCEGCATKIIKLARRLEGVESVKADPEANKLTVIGKVDPSQIREILHQKTKKKVDLISPQPKKEDSNNKDDNKKSSDKKPDAENKKQKEAPVTSAVIKVAFHCLGCIEKIHKIVTKAEGVQELTVDKQKETVTVKGTMDVKALTGGGGGKKKNKGGDGQDKAGGGDAAPKMEGNRMEHVMPPGFGYGPGPGHGYVEQPMPVPGYGGNGHMDQPMPVPVSVHDFGYGYGYGHGQVPGYPVHMMFNDENPNACSVM